MKLFRYTVVALALFSIPESAFAAAKNFSELVASLVSIIDVGTGFLLILGVIVYFWGISVNILKFEDDPEKRKAYFFWGIIVLFIMFSIWGIIELLQNTLFGAGTIGTGVGGPPATGAPSPFTGQILNNN